MVFEVSTPAPAHKKPTNNPLREDGPRHIAYLARAKVRCGISLQMLDEGSNNNPIIILY